MQLNEQGFYESFQLWHIPFWRTLSFLMLIFVIALFLIGILSYWYYTTRKNIKKVKKISIYEQLKQLEELCKLIEKDEDIKEFYYILTLHLKDYLLSYYAVWARGLTDQELITYIKDNVSDRQLIEMIEEVIERSGMIKFVEVAQVQAAMQSDLEKVRIIIEKLPLSSQ